MPRKNGRVQPKLSRLLDANINRAREGIRVVEDTARYVWDDKRLYSSLRKIRHRLTKLTKDRHSDLVKSRQSREDVGRRLVEGGRACLADVVTANMKRAQEAMRVLEEYNKVFSPKFSAEFKRLRYALYVQEKKVNLKNESAA